MKCRACLSEVYDQLKKQTGKDKALLETLLQTKLPNVPDGVTTSGHSPVCIKHFIESKQLW